MTDLRAAVRPELGRRPGTGWAWSGELAALVGSVGTVTTVALSAAQITRLRAAVARVAGLERAAGHDRPVRATLADYCPDPLVFALESGLPRPQILDRVIDGGSAWEQRLDPGIGTLTAVPRITEIVERVTSAGRRLIRTCYETELRTSRGALVGWARGFSLDLEDGDA